MDGLLVGPRRIRVAAMIASLLLSACASVGERIDGDARALAAEVRERTGVELELAAPIESEPLSGELSDETAVRFALRHNPRVRAELASLGVSSAQVVGASRLPNPILSANAKFFSSGTEIELGLAQPLLDLLFLGRRGRIADAEHAGERARVAGVLVELVHDVRKALVDLRAARALVAAREEYFDARQASYDFAQALHAAGNIADQALALEDAALGEAQIAISEAELDALESRERVLVALGMSADDGAWKAEAPLAAPQADALDPRDIEARCVAASLDLRVARAVLVAEGERAGVRSWSALLPGFDAGIVAKQESGGDWGLGPAIDLGLPIFDAGSTLDAESEQRMKWAQERAAALEIEVRSAARTLASRANALREREAFQRARQLARAQRVVETTLQRFNAMQIGAFDVLRAKEAEIEARASHVETLRDLHEARLDVEELLHGHLDRSALSERRATNSMHTEP